MHTKYWPENLKGRYNLGSLCRREDNIKIVVRETGCEGVN
jgi:hypothetical protein